MKYFNYALVIIHCLLKQKYERSSEPGGRTAALAQAGADIWRTPKHEQVAW